MTRATTDQPPLATFNLKGGPLREVVQQVEELMDHYGMVPLNVMYSPEIGKLDVNVPSLTLRNVTGSEALKLVAAAAECEIVSIPGERVGVPVNRVIGYQFFTRPGGSRTSVVAPSEEPKVIAYALSTITTKIKFEELQQSLQEVLQLKGVGPDEVKIAVHEKTNVMVVRAKDAVHELVKQFLEVVSRNVTEGREQAQDEETRNLKIGVEIAQEKARIVETQLERYSLELKSKTEANEELRKQVEEYRTQIEELKVQINGYKERLNIH